MKKLVLLLIGLISFPVFAMQSSGSPSLMPTAGFTSQPIGHYRYCKKYRDDCLIVSLKTRAPELTRDRWDELVEINASTNAAVEPVSDLELYDQTEHWAYPRSYGDCEDYVLMKRKLLMERGWPPSALLITVVRQPNGEGHAVLTVRTDRADLVLDNLRPEIHSWENTPYTYLKRQSRSHSGKWVDIKDTGYASR